MLCHFFLLAKDNAALRLVRRALRNNVLDIAVQTCCESTVCVYVGSFVAACHLPALSLLSVLLKPSCCNAKL